MRVDSWLQTLSAPLATASSATALIGAFFGGLWWYLASVGYQGHPSVAAPELCRRDEVAALALVVLGHAIGALSRRKDYARLRSAARYERTYGVDRGYRAEPRWTAHVTNEPALRALFRVGLARRIAWGIALSSAIVFIGLTRVVHGSAHAEVSRPNAWDFCAYFALAGVAALSHLLVALGADRGFRRMLASAQSHERRGARRTWVP